MWKQKLRNYHTETDWEALLATCIFFILAAFVPNVKIFFLLAFSLFGFLVLRYSFLKAFVYSVLPLSYISVAQIHTILVVPPKAIISNQYWEGRHLVYGFSPYFFVSLVGALLLLFSKKHPAVQLKSYYLIALSFGLCGFLSAAYASLFPSLSALSAIQQIISLVFTWYFSHLLTSNKSESQKFLRTVFLIVAGLIFYESLFVIKQTITQSPVGAAIEAAQFAPVFGLGADESGGFRPFGLQAHPNGLANQQLILISTLFLIFAFLQKKISKLPLKNILLGCLALSLTNIVLSLSRAAIVVIILICILLWLRHAKFIMKTNQMLKKKMRTVKPWQLSLVLFVLGFLFLKLNNRLLFSVYSFSEFGGINTRAIQYAEALEVFKKSPLIGVGDRMFIPTSYQLFPKGVMTYFPEEVHSGLLLLLIERGMLGFSIYMLFLIVVLRKINSSKLYSSTKSVLYSGIIAGLVMMLFHPERNFFSLFILLAMAMIENDNDYTF